MSKPPPDNRPEQRIAEMVASGALSPDQAHELLAALDGRPPQPWYLLLIDPFERFAPRYGLPLFVLLFAVGLWLSRYGLTFGGALSVQWNTVPPLWWRDTLVVAFAMCPIVLVGWLSARLAGAKPRLRDMLGVAAFIRIPMTWLALFAAVIGRVDVASKSLGLTLVAIVGIVALVWFVALSFRGLRWASGLAGGRLWALLLGTLFVAELGSIGGIQLVKGF